MLGELGQQMVELEQLMMTFRGMDR